MVMVAYKDIDKFLSNQSYVLPLLFLSILLPQMPSWFSCNYVGSTVYRKLFIADFNFTCDFPIAYRYFQFTPREPMSIVWSTLG